MLKYKRLLAGAATAALVATMALAGCGSSAPANSSSSASSGGTASSTKNSEAASNASAAQNTASGATDANSNSAPTISSLADYIGTDAAKEAALGHAGVSLAEATDVCVELDTDDATIHYDVDFKAGGLEYDYEIDAVSGDVLSSSSEVDD